MPYVKQMYALLLKQYRGMGYTTIFTRVGLTFRTAWNAVGRFFIASYARNRIHLLGTNNTSAFLFEQFDKGQLPCFLGGDMKIGNKGGLCCIGVKHQPLSKMLLKYKINNNEYVDDTNTDEEQTSATVSIIN